MIKVLIVDDSKVLIKMLKKGFKKYKDHFEPIFAENGLEAMDILDQQQVSVVVTDVQMPMVDGLILLAFVKERFPDTNCIMMSAYGDDELKKEVDKDIYHFIDKPIHIGKLAKLIISAAGMKTKKKSNRKAIVDIINIIVLGRKTCIFKLTADKGETGYFFFYEGELYNAVCGNMKGLEAMTKMLNYPTANIIFMKPPEHKVERQINMDAASFIQQAKASPLSVSMMGEPIYI